RAVRFEPGDERIERAVRIADEDVWAERHRPFEEPREVHVARRADGDAEAELRRRIPEARAEDVRAVIGAETADEDVAPTLARERRAAERDGACEVAGDDRIARRLQRETGEE